MTTRKLFCEISPVTYRISVQKESIRRSIGNVFSGLNFAGERQEAPLPVLIYSHKSLIRRKLGNANMQLQENKAVNLSIAAPKVSGILIKPGQTFSFWKLVGSCTQRKGYREGLLISGGEIESGIGGGLCQFTNLIHWMALHTPLEIREHHHHDGLDMFPDFGRQVPFGVGTSIMHNYLDYRLTNNTDAAFQLIIYVTAEYLCGELRSDKPADVAYHITVENERFTEERGQFYRNNEIYRKCIDKRTGDTISNELIKKNHAQVMYDKSHIPEGKIVPQE